MRNVHFIFLGICSCLFTLQLQAQTKSQQKNGKARSVLIKNGEDVLIEDHPYQADLGGCGGTVIGDKWIVTAEHCVGGIVGRTIGVGYTKRSNRTTGQTARVKRVLNFECGGYCDLSLLELETPLDLSGKYVKAIKYASADVFTEGYVKKDMECYATGWGQLDPNGGESPDNLQGALLRFGEVQVSDFRIRVEETEGRLVCRGDSGGPLVVFNSDKSERILVGAVSGGEGTPCTDYGFWGNVANAATWIEEQTGIKPYVEGPSLGVIRSVKKPTFDIWPVPARNVLHVTSKSEIKEIKIYTLFGKEVLQTKDVSNVNLTSLSEGTYVLQDAGSLASSLFVVKK